MSDKKYNVVEQFVDCLERDAFRDAIKFLADDCLYYIHEELLTGSEAIMNLYQSNVEEGRKVLDKLEWGLSMITPTENDSYEVMFTDIMQHKQIEHEYKCMQRFHINDDLLINEIHHFELETERKKLDQFYIQAGLR